MQLWDLFTDLERQKAFDSYQTLIEDTVREQLNTYHSLAKILKEKGYNTYSLHGFDKTFWNRDEMHMSLGLTDFLTKRILYWTILPDGMVRLSAIHPSSGSL